jgi:hypothetical protein
MKFLDHVNPSQHGMVTPLSREQGHQPSNFDTVTVVKKPRQYPRLDVTVEINNSLSTTHMNMALQVSLYKLKLDAAMKMVAKAEALMRHIKTNPGLAFTFDMLCYSFKRRLKELSI